jgi:hypothetical protein
MRTPLSTEVQALKDLSHDARKFRTVLDTFGRNASMLFVGTPFQYEIDHHALALAFAKWREGFDHSKSLAQMNRTDFVVFAAGLMMKELVAAAPLKISSIPAATGTDVVSTEVSTRMSRWPEGYAYASYCMALAAAVAEQGGDHLETRDIVDTPQFWDSFRENATDDAANAVAFFDLLCGREPNWESPDVPYLRKAFSEIPALQRQ